MTRTRTARTAGACLVSLAAIAAGGGPQQRPSPDSSRTMRVMTYNIKHGQSNAACVQPPVAAGQPPAADCNLNLDGTIAVLRAHTPDIIALQEVDRFWARSGSTDQVTAIAGGLQMTHHCYAPNLDHPADNHSNRPHQYGTAIVSRYPIVSCSNTLLTTFAGWEQRGILGAVIDVRGVHTRVYSTHLQAGRTVAGTAESGGPQRVLQVQDIVRLLADVTDPIVLMGDFNAGSSSNELQPLISRLRDVWVEAGSGSGNTSSARLTGDPTSRIDYIFVSPGTSISSVAVPIDAQTRLASDHYPVISSIVVPGI
jgi:endonuclease/exonuclease/phosphatase family metal-dependent hydrolase